MARTGNLEATAGRSEMTVKDLIEELEFYDKDMEIVFEVCDDFEPESITEYRCGCREVTLDAKIKPNFISNVMGKVYIEFGKE